MLGSLKKKPRFASKKKKKIAKKKNPSNLANPTPQPTHETNNTGMYYLGAIEPCLHSDSKEEDRSPKVVSCFSGKEEDRSPKAIALFDMAIAGSRKRL